MPFPFSRNRCFPQPVLLYLPQPDLTVITSAHLSPYTVCIRQWMPTGEIFYAVKHSITAHSLRRTSSQSSISTGTEPELRTAVGSTLRMVEGRYHVTACNRFDPVFINIKKMTVEVKLLSPSSYLISGNIAVMVRKEHFRTRPLYIHIFLYLNFHKSLLMFYPQTGPAQV